MLTGRPGECEVCGRCGALADYAPDSGARRGELCTACVLLVRSLTHPDQRDRVRRALDYVLWHAGRARVAEHEAADNPR